MIAIRHYYTDTYQLSEQTRVISITAHAGNHHIKLASTLFHPQGGGQPADQGMINNLRVVNVINSEDNDVEHIVDSNDFAQYPVQCNDMVTLTIDAATRFKHAALHTAGHMIHIILMNDALYAPLLQNPKGNHFPEQAKITYDIHETATIDKEALSNLLISKMHTLIANQYPIDIQWSQDQKHRYIQIGAYKEEGCGGTHLSNTKHLEATSFTIRKIEIKKGKIAIGYTCEPSSELKKMSTHKTI